jgi:hypothetical protein
VQRLLGNRQLCGELIWKYSMIIDYLREEMVGNVVECVRAVGLPLGEFIMLLLSQLKPVYSLPVRLLFDLPSAPPPIIYIFIKKNFLPCVCCTFYFGQPFSIICHFSYLFSCKHEYLCTVPINSSRFIYVTGC